MRAFSTRAIATATAAAIALTATGIPSFAASSANKPAQIQQGTVTDMSAAKKKRYRSHRGYNPGGAAVLGAVGTLFGVIAANAARERYHERYYQPYGYYGYGGGYGYQPYAYRPAPYYYYGY